MQFNTVFPLPSAIMSTPDLRHDMPSLSKRQTKPTLLSLGPDILHRIVHYILLPSHSGKPYFRPRPCPAALNLAMTCRTMRDVVSSHIKSDATWWTDPRSDGVTIPSPQLYINLRASLFNSYSYFGSSLTEIRFGKEEYFADGYPYQRYDSDTVLHRILNILISQPPQSAHNRCSHIQVVFSSSLRQPLLFSSVHPKHP